MNVLFVCTGNTCRSPMAAALFNKFACEKELDVRIESAGIQVIPRMSASKQAIEVMKDYGIDLSEHLTKQIDRELIDASNLILTMTEYHKAALLPFAKGKVQMLSEFAGEAEEVSDPYGGDVEVYRECAREIYQLLLKVADRIADIQNDN